MKPIGIFLAYAPEQPMKNQGLGRLLGFIISGILEEPNSKIIIAAPAWYKETLINFLQDQKITDDRIELLLTNGIPYLLKIRNFFSKILKKDKGEKTEETNFIRLIKNFVFKVFVKWFSTSSTILFIFYCLLALCISILALPLLITAALCKVIKNYISNKFPEFERKFNSGLRFLKGSPLKVFKNSAIAQKIYNELRASELRKLITKVNSRGEIKTWYVPSLFWPEIANIKNKKVVAAPDLVFVEFPSLFTSPNWHKAYEIVKSSLFVGDHYICYSEHVKQNHLLKPFFIPPNKVTVIEHGFIELNKFFKSNVTWRNEAVEIIKKYQKENLFEDVYLRDFDFNQARFIFYSSQIRPHKNFMNLIRAVEILIRKRFANIKLVLTAQIDLEEETLKFIKDRKLHRDIIWIPDIPTNVLAALNHLALCAVNPTLFEGGFPFTFTEAYSVGTPSVMSNIPLVLEKIEDPQLIEKMLFDPYNVDDIVNKVEWAINHRDELIKLQEPLYDKFKQRSWNLVAKEYVNLLNNFSTNTV